MEEYVKEVKKLLEYSLAEPVAEFNKIINMFENKM